MLNASLRQCKRLVGGSSTSLVQVLLFQVFLVVFFNEHVLLCFDHAWRRISLALWTPDPKKFYRPAGPSPIRPNKLWICSENGATVAGPKPLVVNLVVVGLFKQE